MTPFYDAFGRLITGGLHEDPRILSGDLSHSDSIGTSCIPTGAEVSSAVTDTNFPITAAAVATALGVPAATPSYIWTCQETTDNNLVDALQDEQLFEGDVDGAEWAIATSGLQGSRTAIRLTILSSERFAASNVLIGDLTQSTAWMAVYNVAVENAATLALLSKGRGLAAAPAADNAGIVSSFDSLGRLTTTISDGTASVANSLIVGDSNDGNWHIGGMVYNATAQTVKTMNEISEHTRDVSTLTFVTNNSYFTIGDSRFPAAGADIAYVLLFEGAAAEAVTQASLATFHTQMVTA